MISKTIKNDYYSPTEYYNNEGMITEKQIKTLTSLIYQNIQNEDQRENYLAQISEMSYEEAEEMILEFLSNKW